MLNHESYKDCSILIVDDMETNIDILVELLSDFDLLAATDWEYALEITNNQKVDLILLDIVMPGKNGFEVSEILKSKEKTKNIPIIFITANTDEDSIEKAYAVGGLDYVTKPFKPRELIARVVTQLKMKKLMEDLEFKSSYDSLTGVYNRGKFFELSSNMFRTNRQNLYTIMFDIDKFKNINDNYGHPTGDLVIKTFAKTLACNVIEDGVLGRIGGEEFALVARFESEEKAYDYIEFVRNEVSKLEVESECGDYNVSFTVSAGICKITDETLSLDAALKISDEALYEAKTSGRNKSIIRG